MQVAVTDTVEPVLSHTEHIAQMEATYLQSGELELNLPGDMSDHQRAAAAQDMSVAFEYLPAARRPDTLRFEGLPKRSRGPRR